MAAVGKTVANSEAQLRACEFLLTKQCPDGGWGENYLSCQDKVCLPFWFLISCLALALLFTKSDMVFQSEVNDEMD